MYTLAFTKLLPLLLTGAGIGFLITIHEFGHFIFAKLFNIGVPVFSIGFGPGLIKKRIGATEYRLSLIPLGGYCAIQMDSDPEAGMVTPDPEAAPLDPAQSFDTKPFWQKLLVLLGGILFNIAFAYIAFIGLHCGTRPKVVTEIIATAITEKSPAAKSRIAIGDRITGYDGITFGSGSASVHEQIRTFLDTIAAKPQQKMLLAITTKDMQEKVRRVTLGETADKAGFLGVAMEIKQVPIEGQYESDTFFDAIHKGIGLTNFYIKNTFAIIPSKFKRRNLDGLVGPLGLFSYAYTSAQQGLRSLLYFLSTFSVTLAIMNLIPIGALDGGQLLFTLIEGITRRRLPRKLKEGIIIGSWILFMLLTITLLYRDVLGFIGA